MAQRDLYDPSFVRGLFDEMAKTYGAVNLISSLGVARHWRRLCVRSIEIKSDATVLDLMTGMGELCGDISTFLSEDGEIVAMDISSVMCDRARKQAGSLGECSFRVVEANALESPIEDASVDCVISTFGLKTFNPTQIRQLAAEVNRVLRPGGQFAFLEISVPSNRLMRWPYLAYVNHFIPLIGRLFLGNPENYSLLGVYTSEFGNCEQAVDSFAEAGLDVTYQSFLFETATGFFGHRPQNGKS